MFGAATVVPAPPADPALVALGRRLFFEKSLSAGRTLSCASCHDPARAWAGGPRAPGGRDVPSLLGAARRGPFFLDGRAETLEDAVAAELADPRALGLDERALAARLDALPEGPALLDAAGETGTSARRAARALAAFLRAEAVSGESPFDRSARAPASYPAPAARGLALFVGKGRCASCHSGPWLSDGSFYRVGLRDGDPLDRGREAVTPVRQMRGAFRTPPLRDVARTAPYMHDGSVPTLAAVVALFDRGGDELLGLSHDVWPIGLSAAERADLVAFLESLTGVPRPVAPPPVPAARPDPVAAAESWRAKSERALAARDRGALRDAADSWARALAAQRAGAPAGASGCLTNAAAAAGDLAAMADTGRDWPVLSARRALAEEWDRECAFRAGRASDSDADGAEALTARAEALVRARADAAGGGAAERECRRRLDFDGLLALLRARPFDDDAEQNVAKQAVLYAAYRALRAGDPAACDRLTFTSMAVGVAQSGILRCRELYTDLEQARALAAGDPAFEGLCRANAALSYPDLPSADAAAVCALIAGKSSDPEALCSALSPRFVPAELKAACVSRFRLFAGRGGGEDCRALEAGPSIIRDQCLDMAAYAKARASRDPAACGASAACRLLAGVGKDEEDKQWAVVAGLACRPPAAPASLARVESLLSRADAALTREEGSRAPGDRAAAAALDARAERAARARAAAEAAFSAPNPQPTPY